MAGHSLRLLTAPRVWLSRCQRRPAWASGARRLTDPLCLAFTARDRRRGDRAATARRCALVAIDALRRKDFNRELLGAVRRGAGQEIETATPMVAGRELGSRPQRDQIEPPSTIL